MIELQFEADIRAGAERVFSLLAELRDYDRWLPRSSAFRGTSKISDGPIAVGYDLCRAGTAGTRHGVVTALVRPTRLDFEQPMTLRPRFLGTLGIRLFHTLTPAAGSVHLLRRLELSPQGPVRFLMRPVAGAFRVENMRMMQTLKAFAEKAETGNG